MNVDVDRVRARLTAMRQMLDHLESLGELSAADLEGDFGLRLQVERALSQVVTLATEINSHVVARELGRAPVDLTTSFADLARAGWIDDHLARTLRGSAGLRNILVHEYVEVDLAIVAEATAMAVPSYGDYVRQVASHL